MHQQPELCEDKRHKPKRRNATEAKKAAHKTLPIEQSVATCADYQQRPTGPWSTKDPRPSTQIPLNELIDEFNDITNADATTPPWPTHQQEEQQPVAREYVISTTSQGQADGAELNVKTILNASPTEDGYDNSLGWTPKVLAPTLVSIGPPNAHGLSSSLPHGSTKPDPKKCNRPSSVKIDSTQIDSTRTDRPASEPVAQEELNTHAIGEATCEMGMATTTAGNNEQRARLTHEGDAASKYATPPASSTCKGEVTTDDITQDGTNATPTLNLGSVTSKDHAHKATTRR